mmetsp:Transcript_21375/g.32298  ORF Transcript_21375/g.32298 Transcript_21375/m.32298 type:complete len:86 (-) Transcript_21375:355-612(-)
MIIGTQPNEHLTPSSAISVKMQTPSPAIPTHRPLKNSATIGSTYYQANSPLRKRGKEQKSSPKAMKHRKLGPRLYDGYSTRNQCV